MSSTINLFGKSNSEKKVEALLEEVKDLLIDTREQLNKKDVVIRDLLTLVTSNQEGIEKLRDSEVFQQISTIYGGSSNRLDSSSNIRNRETDELILKVVTLLNNETGLPVGLSFSTTTLSVGEIKELVVPLTAYLYGDRSGPDVYNRIYLPLLAVSVRETLRIKYKVDLPFF
jgi:hypothetical protein